MGGPHPHQSRLHFLKRLFPQRKGIPSAGGLQTQIAALISISSLCPLSGYELSILPDRTGQLLKRSSSMCPRYSSAFLEQPDGDNTVSTGPKRVRRWNSVLSAGRVSPPPPALTHTWELACGCASLCSHPHLVSSTQ